MDGFWKNRNFDKLGWKHSEAIGAWSDYEDTILRSQAGELQNVIVWPNLSSDYDQQNFYLHYDALCQRTWSLVHEMHMLCIK